MAKIVNELEAWSSIEKIVSDAEKFVVLISPYIGTNDLIELIKKRQNKSVYIQLFTYRSQSFQNEVDRTLKLLDKFPNIIVRTASSEFHAKCYFNEKEVLISSMNLSTQLTKFELGVLISKEWDKSLFADAMRNVNEVCKLMGMKEEDFSQIVNHVVGYCIYCGKQIDLNLERPYCSDCSNIVDTSGTYCHWCKKSHTSTVYRPMHKYCYYGYRDYLYSLD